MSFHPNPEQERALVMLDEWWADGARDTFVLHGYAGTGKTTLVKHWCQSREVRFQPLAYTWKAATLWDRGRSVHSYLNMSAYDPLTRLRQQIFDEKDSKKQDRLIKEYERKSKTREGKLQFSQGMYSGYEEASQLIVLDEALMVDKRLARTIENERLPVIALGDPFQLPPIDGKPFYSDPDIELTQVMRQGDGSGVLELATAIRETTWMPNPQAIGKLIRDHGEFDPIAADEADIVLAATRKRRDAYVKRRLGGRYRLVPVRGEPLVALNNVFRGDADAQCYNGQMFTVVDATEHHDGPDGTVYLVAKETRPGPDGTRQYFAGVADCSALRKPSMDKFAASNTIPAFGWGHAVTIHKSQGSEWDHVHLLQDWTKYHDGKLWEMLKKLEEGQLKLTEDEIRESAMDETQRLVYTAVTRARARLTVGNPHN